MKSIKFALMLTALTCSFISCSKDSDEEGSACEDENTTTVTFKNVWQQAIRVQVSTQLTPQYESIDPVVTLDLAPGQSMSKVIQADSYQIVWRNGCPSNCSLASSYAKTYESCQEYNEQLSD